jgi:cysteinyl-tRNA synthetase, unknown class
MAENEPRLADVRHWLLLLDNDLKPETIQTIAASDHDMVVIDDLSSSKGYSATDMAATVAALKTKPDGSRRIVIAYLNVGQAEDYRTYWHKGWRIGSPSWILGSDPDGWKGNFPVAYWQKPWQDLIVGRDGLLPSIVASGFDGVYLDWIGGFEDQSVIAAAKREGLDPRAEIIAWISRFSIEAKSLKPNFIVIGQNATTLLTDDAYLAALDAVAQEDIWFTGADGGLQGDCPVPRSQAEVGSPEFIARLSGPCLRAFKKDRGGAMHFAGESEIVPLLDLARGRNKPVFTVDYALASSNVAWVAQHSREKGFVPFVGARSLSAYVPPIRD